MVESIVQVQAALEEQELPKGTLGGGNERGQEQQSDVQKGQNPESSHSLKKPPLARSRLGSSVVYDEDWDDAILPDTSADVQPQEEIPSHSASSDDNSDLRVDIAVAEKDLIMPTEDSELVEAHEETVEDAVHPSDTSEVNISQSCNTVDEGDSLIIAQGRPVSENVNMDSPSSSTPCSNKDSILSTGAPATNRLALLEQSITEALDDITNTKRELRQVVDRIQRLTEYTDEQKIALVSLSTRMDVDFNRDMQSLKNRLKHVENKEVHAWERLLELKSDMNARISTLEKEYRNRAQASHPSQSERQGISEEYHASRLHSEGVMENAGAPVDSAPNAVTLALQKIEDTMQVLWKFLAQSVGVVRKSAKLTVKNTRNAISWTAAAANTTVRKIRTLWLAICKLYCSAFESYRRQRERLAQSLLWVGNRLSTSPQRDLTGVKASDSPSADELAMMVEQSQLLKQTARSDRKEFVQPVTRADKGVGQIVSKLTRFGIRPYTTSPYHIYIIDTHEETETFMKIVQEVSGKYPIQIVGLDCETAGRKNQDQVNNKGPPSMVQIAFAEGLVGIFQVYRMCSIPLSSGETQFDKGRFPKALREFVQSSRPLKTGVGVWGDYANLSQYYGIKVPVAAIIDTGHLASAMGLDRRSLEALSYRYCNMVLRKNRPTGTSYKWDTTAAEMGRNAVLYAANDAMASLRVYKSMIQPPPGEHSKTPSGNLLAEVAATANESSTVNEVYVNPESLFKDVSKLLRGKQYPVPRIEIEKWMVSAVKSWHDLSIERRRTAARLCMEKWLQDGLLVEGRGGLTLRARERATLRQINLPSAKSMPEPSAEVSKPPETTLKPPNADVIPVTATEEKKSVERVNSSNTDATLVTSADRPNAAAQSADPLEKILGEVEDTAIQRLYRQYFEAALPRKTLVSHLQHSFPWVSEGKMIQSAKKRQALAARCVERLLEEGKLRDVGAEQLQISMEDDKIPLDIRRRVRDAGETPYLELCKYFGTTRPIPYTALRDHFEKRIFLGLERQVRKMLAWAYLRKMYKENKLGVTGSLCQLVDPNRSSSVDAQSLQATETPTVNASTTHIEEDALTTSGDEADFCKVISLALENRACQQSVQQKSSTEGEAMERVPPEKDRQQRTDAVGGSRSPSVDEEQECAAVCPSASEASRALIEAAEGQSSNDVMISQGPISAEPQQDINVVGVVEKNAISSGEVTEDAVMSERKSAPITSVEDGILHKTEAHSSADLRNVSASHAKTGDVPTGEAVAAVEDVMPSADRAASLDMSVSDEALGPERSAEANRFDGQVDVSKISTEHLLPTHDISQIKSKRRLQHISALGGPKTAGELYTWFFGGVIHVQGILRSAGLKTAEKPAHAKLRENVVASESCPPLSNSLAESAIKRVVSKKAQMVIAASDLRPISMSGSKRRTAIKRTLISKLEWNGEEVHGWALKFLLAQRELKKGDADGKWAAYVDDLIGEFLETTKERACKRITLNLSGST